MKAVTVLGIALLALGIAATAQAGTRLYTGTLILDSYGNDTSTGTVTPFITKSWSGIPLQASRFPGWQPDCPSGCDASSTSPQPTPRRARA